MLQNKGEKMAFKTCPNCGNKVPTTKVVCPHCGYRFNQNANGGMLLALALVLAIVFAPVIIVLGLFGKFLLKGLYKNILGLEEFKKFRKTYTIICFSWFFLSIAFIVVCGVLQLEIVEYAFYVLCGGNIALFALSIVFGNKIYKKHKDDIPTDSNTAKEVDSEAELIETEDTTTESATEESSNSNAGMFGSNEYDNKKKKFELLAELAALRDANVLTEEEFNEQKQQILRAHCESVPQTVTSSKASTEKTVRGDIKETNENQKRVSKLLSTINLILTILTFITFAVGIVFLCTARINVLLEENADGTIHWITSNYIEAIFDGWDISPLCLLTTIGAILMTVVLLVKMKAEIKHTQDDKKMIITDLLTLLVSAVPIVFSAITADYYVNAGLLLFLILSSSSGVLIAMHLLLLLIKKLV
jgi:predicted nucleic acid-binding Zn ribbon protein